MAIEPDPYRVLELSRGASLDEVKRAYRRLAKANHPDAAGESALPRFLAIQAAYEQLIGGPGAAARSRRAAPPARRAWEADPDRSDATRRAYGGRARTTPPGARGPASGPEAGAGTAGAAGGAAGTGASRKSRSKPGTGAGGTTSARPGRRRRKSADDSPGTPPPDPKRASRSAKPNKATLGSTSYDGVEATEFEPDWRGASWYGTTSGTYWTLNPKEYADPRKHGPEYQARARRAARGGTPGAATPRSASFGTVPEVEVAAGPTHTTSSWWDSTAGEAGWASAGDSGPAASRPTAPPPMPPRPAATTPTPTTSGGASDLGRAAANLGQMLTDERSGGMTGRIVRAIIGWLPIAIAIGWGIGEMTGCGRFAATCDGASEPLVLGLQVVSLAILLLVPGLALLASMAALIMLGAAVLGALILSSTGEAADLEARAAALGAILVVAWCIGLGIAIVHRARAAPSPTRPVS